MENRRTPFFIVLFALFIAMLLTLWVENRRLETVTAARAGQWRKASFSFWRVSLDYAPNSISTEYPIEETNPTLSATYRPTSTPWPSKTPTLTPSYFYRATNTVAGMTPATPTPLQDKTMIMANTLTAFYLTQTARYTTAEATETPTETATATPEPTDASPGTVEESSTPVATNIPSILNQHVRTDKTDRYQENHSKLNWPFYILILLMISLGVFLYTRKSHPE